MREIQNKAQLNEYLEKEQILSHFTEKNLPFHLIQYEKGEFLTRPDHPLSRLLFVVKGQLKVYGIREDGTTFAVKLEKSHAVLGDVEFCQKTAAPFFAEAMEPVVCVGLLLDANREILDRDTVFLRFMLDAMADKLWQFVRMDVCARSLEEKVVTYLTELQPDHTLRGVNAALAQFHCSRRQLQRVLKKLCEDGVLEKSSKGHYTLQGAETLPS